MGRKLVRFSAICDASIFYELLEILEGKAVAGTVQFQTVKHAGESEDGKLKSMPSGREFMLTYLAKYSAFRARDAQHAAAELGLHKQTIYTAIHTLVKEGALKRTGVGHYAVKGAKALAKAATVVKGKNKHQPTGGKGKKRVPGLTTPDRIVAFLRGKQNGSGEGVHIREIKKAVGTNGVSPGLTSLMRRKIVTRPSPGHYRVAEA